VCDHRAAPCGSGRLKAAGVRSRAPAHPRAGRIPTGLRLPVALPGLLAAERTRSLDPGHKKSRSMRFLRPRTYTFQQARTSFPRNRAIGERPRLCGARSLTCPALPCPSEVKEGVRTAARSHAPARLISRLGGPLNPGCGAGHTPGIGCVEQHRELSRADRLSLRRAPAQDG
jgi:hypothetical protein